MEIDECYGSTLQTDIEIAFGVSETGIIAVSFIFEMEKKKRNLNEKRTVWETVLLYLEKFLRLPNGIYLKLLLCKSYHN